MARPKGSLNKVNAFWRDAIASALYDYTESGDLAEDLRSIKDPHLRLQIADKLASYISPRQQAVKMETEVKVNSERAESIIDSLTKNK